mgnify:CR=1 FL=1
MLEGFFLSFFSVVNVSVYVVVSSTPQSCEQKPIGSFSTLLLVNVVVPLCVVHGEIIDQTSPPPSLLPSFCALVEKECIPDWHESLCARSPGGGADTSLQQSVDVELD